MSPHSDPILRLLHDMRVSVGRLTAATIALYLLLAIASGIAFYLLIGRANDNRQLITQANEDRAENRARYKRSDVLLCRGVEQLKSFNRDNAQKVYDFRIMALRRLKSLTPELEATALDNLNADLQRNQPRGGGCGELPSLGAKG